MKMADAVGPVPILLSTGQPMNEVMTIPNGHVGPVPILLSTGEGVFPSVPATFEAIVVESLERLETIEGKENRGRCRIRAVSSLPCSVGPRAGRI